MDTLAIYYNKLIDKWWLQTKTNINQIICNDTIISEKFLKDWGRETFKITEAFKCIKHPPGMFQ